MSNNDTSIMMILNYHDAVLYQSDLAILQSPRQWLNDACIHFFLTRLSQLHHSHSSTADSPTVMRYTFVDPSVLSFFMHQWDEEEDDSDDDVLGLKQQQQEQQPAAFFLPINDNYVSQSWATPGGGTHWSLLLVTVFYARSKTDDDTAHGASPSSTTFWHFDSSAGSNRGAARAVANKIQKVFSTWNRDDRDAGAASTPQLHECTVPQQSNGYDCGLYMLATAEALAAGLTSSFRNGHGPTKKELEQMVQASVATSPSFCQALRTRVAKDVERLAAAR